MQALNLLSLDAAWTYCLTIWAVPEFDVEFAPFGEISTSDKGEV
jgi:hypothetical protein